MNKAYWNKVILDRSVPAGKTARMIDHSYGLMVKGLPKAQREALVGCHPGIGPCVESLHQIREH